MNFIGIAAWLIILAFAIFMIFNIRSRHLRMIVEKKRPLMTWLIDLLELIVWVGAIGFMFWATWVRPVDINDPKNVSKSFSYRALVLQPDADASYYVRAQSRGQGRLATYTYWTQGAKTTINSDEADVSYGTNLLTVRAAAFPWEMVDLKPLDKKNGKAWVATITVTYKDNFWNGLAMRVGRKARFDLIRIPNETLLKVVPISKKDK